MTIKGSKAAMAVSVLLSLGAFAVSTPAAADAADELRAFVRDVKSARSDFTQTVTAPDGVKKKVSSGTFEFQRPNRFRFTYTKPFEQVIVADGQKVWIYDADLNQVSARKLSQALGSTPAALLAGGSLEKDFDLKALPDRDGLAWVDAAPKVKDGAFQSVRVGFKGRDLAALEITDGFAQKSLLQFTNLAANAAVPAESFVFKVPTGADVIEQ
ncbi:outer membrane lipoprotein chaperone LolA [soil metagenome]